MENTCNCRFSAFGNVSGKQPSTQGCQYGNVFLNNQNVLMVIFVTALGSSYKSPLQPFDLFHEFT